MRRALALLCLVGGCQRGDTLTVSAAVSLKEPMIELGRVFEAGHPGVHVVFNFAASGDLARQIEAGAPVDAFAAAADAPMDRLAAAGRIDAGSRRAIAENRLVLVARRDGPGAALRFATIGSARFRRLAIGDPRTVPAGGYAIALLDALGAHAAVADRLLPAANVRVALDLVAHGEAEAGIVYLTDVPTVPGLTTVDVAPDGQAPRVVYPMAVVTGTAHPVEARAFVDCVAGADGRRVLAARGYRLP